MSEAERHRLLNILEAHGKSFLGYFSPLHAGSNTGKRKNRDKDNFSNKRCKKAKEEEEEEWHGINHDLLGHESPSGEEYANDDEGDAFGSEDDFEHTDDEFTSTATQKNIIIFSDINPKKPAVVDHVAKAQKKAFMSSKTSKMSSSTSITVSKRSQEEEDEKTNLQNDALLHKLVHTKLLSGSMNTELDLTPARRRKALAGRVLELSGEAKLGKGEKAVRAAERTRAAKRVREGLVKKQQERRTQELEEAQNLGNYHPTLKKLFEASSSRSNRNREKGMKMGVGTFSNGSLRLRKEDVNAVMGGGFSRRGGSSSQNTQHRKRK